MFLSASWPIDPLKFQSFQTVDLDPFSDFLSVSKNKEAGLLSKRYEIDESAFLRQHF